ncbi:MAG: hypothetical protein JRH20_04395 [Deltaproteobacteria bacterium]|nr:hypothetical protein [Deltaproteobacteria bacterium]
MKRMTMMTACLIAGLSVNLSSVSSAHAARGKAQPAWAKALPKAYDKTFSAAQKKQHLMDRAHASKYAELPAPSTTSKLKKLGVFSRKAIPFFLRKTFTVKSDVMPAGDGTEAKMVHTDGALAEVALKLGNKTYKHAIARFSLAGPPKDSFIPGLGIKVLRDNEQQSFNLLVMDTPLGQGPDHNFFARPFRNWFKPPKFSDSPKLAAVNAIFRMAKKNTNFLAIPKDLLKEAGLPEKTDLTFEPTAFARGLISSDSRQPFQADLAKSIGSALAQAEGSVVLSTIRDASGNKVGQLEVLSKPVASAFGDQKFFVTHPFDNE